MGQDNAALLKSKALHILARREHTRHELAVKLSSRNVSQPLIESVLQTLEDERLLSDVRATDLYIRQRVNKGYGEGKVRAELFQKGVERTCIDGCLADANIDWQQVARTAFEKKFSGLANGDQKLLMKQQRFLAARGFSSELISKVLRSQA
jgi:regulatory protein